MPSPINRNVGTLVPDGNKIAALRQLQGKSQRDLTCKNLSLGTIQNAEAGKSIKVTFLKRLATQLGVEFVVILSEGAKSQLQESIQGTKSTKPSHTLFMPSAITDYVGHQRLIDEITASLKAKSRTVTLYSFNGIGGAGKSTTAVLCAEQVKSAFPGGQLFVEMRGMRDPIAPADAMRQIVRAFQPTASLPDDPDGLLTAYRSAFASSKPALIILDDVKDEAQLTGLLDGLPSITFLITSRRNLDVKGNHHRLDCLNPAESLALLRSILGLKGTDEELGRLATLLGHLPLALRVAGDYLIQRDLWSVERYLKAVTDEKERLVRLKGAGIERDVEAVLALSARQLIADNPEQAARWQQLTVFPADFDSAAAAAVWELDEPTAFDELTDLHDRSMLEASDGRFKLHDLTRPIAKDLFSWVDAHPLEQGTAARLLAAQHRFAMYFAICYHQFEVQFNEGHNQAFVALAGFDREAGNIQSSYHWAIENWKHDSVAGMVVRVFVNWFGTMARFRISIVDRIIIAEASRDLCKRDAEQIGEALALSKLGEMYQSVGQMAEAESSLRSAESIYLIIDRPRDRAVNLGRLADVLMQRGEFDEALRILREELLPVFERLGDIQSKAVTLGKIADVLMERGEFDEALRIRREEQLPVFERLGDVRSKAVALGKIADVLTQRGEFDEALRIYREEQLPVYERLGDVRSISASQWNMGMILFQRNNPGDRAEAIHEMEKAVTMAKSLKIHEVTMMERELEQIKRASVS